MLKDPKPPMIPKETSLTTHPEASTKMYSIKKKDTQTSISCINYTLVHLKFPMVVFLTRDVYHEVYGWEIQMRMYFLSRQLSNTLTW